MSITHDDLDCYPIHSSYKDLDGNIQHIYTSKEEHENIYLKCFPIIPRKEKLGYFDGFPVFADKLLEKNLEIILIKLKI